jgi:transcription-repair coupling factor (superfamily II helicase)
MAFDWLIQAIQSSAAEIIRNLETGDISQGDDSSGPGPMGLRRSARLPVLAAIYQQLHRPILLITDRSDRSLVLADELSLWLPSAPRMLFPEPNPLFYEDLPWGESTRRDRLAALTTLASYHVPGGHSPKDPPVIVAPARAVMARTLPRQDFLRASRTYKLGQTIQPDDVARHCVSLGYEPVTTVVAAGQFARRGGLIDIWPPADPSPARIEFFGDEIDTLRRFDPFTQRTVRVAEDGKPDRLIVTPAREYIVSAGFTPPSQGQGVLGEGSVTEFHIPLIHAVSAGIIDYLPRNAIVLIDDWSDFQDVVSEMEEQALNLRQDLEADGTLPADFPLPYLTLAEIGDSLSLHTSMQLGPSSSPEGPSLAEYFKPGARFGGRLKPVLDHLLTSTEKGEQIVIVSRQSQRLVELWEEIRPVEPPPDTGYPVSNPLFIESSLGEGWIFSPDKKHPIHLLTDGEIFGLRRPEPRMRAARRAEEPEAPYADLQPGDWVVHVDHGIGRLVGLVDRTVEGVEREYLCVEYAEGDQLFVPVYQADRLTRYVGPDSRVPSPTRLGSAEWRNVKSRASEAVEEVAEELLRLYAQRQIIEGYPFEKDSTWQKELEASFPYVETEDQLRVIGEVKRDMEARRPMDRLICGDVGYGKTEVALRAAFKAVMSGRQVAVLVPTTVLAQQHYNTFRERLAPFSVEVEMLSRFRSPQQQKEILGRLARGKVDMIIGTHRLLQSDVHFKDMGLLIIDEEQRFGVTHKETLKQMRTEVDVLTLTATPIPRTLYMALTGVRDISTINTPPEERLPIVTHVGPYSPRIVRQAILRELERGGQVFFVHNRVQTIDAMRRHMEKLVPEARITVAHGQMDENQLSHRMDLFTNGDVDVLLSTSIIESGLDIPNANTLIVDRADTFGLAQLYQLRGRVGRGAQRAYAYFFRHRKRPPSIEGRARLEVISENTQLGAGYSIAMRDLEIRGAGDILGTHQSGHITAVGFHLYTRLLADAVRRMKKGKTARAESEEAVETAPETSENLKLLAAADPHRPLVSVDLPLPISLPADYIADKDMRLRLYRRLANMKKLEEVDAVAVEFNDRFGALPEEARNLLYQIKVKLLSDVSGVFSVSGENGQIVIRFPQLPERVNQRRFPEFGVDVRTGKNSLWLQMSDPNWQTRLIEVLSELSQEPAGAVNRQ